MRYGLIGVMRLIAAIVAYHHSQWSMAPSPTSPALDAEPSVACEGNTRCAEMHSCEEAAFYLEHCPNTRMDEDNDGVPCEPQWCRADRR